jgi:hypothetical protein
LYIRERREVRERVGVERYERYEKRRREFIFFLTMLKNEENEVSSLFIVLDR